MQTANKDSVNVIFRGVYPLLSYGQNPDRLFAIFDQSLRRAFGDNAANNCSLHPSNKVHTLNPKRSVARCAFIDGEWLTAECGSFGEIMPDPTDVEKLIIAQV